MFNLYLILFFLYTNISYSYTNHKLSSANNIHNLCNDSKTNVTRVRFAPSPTGKLHIGGARTHLFNQLFSVSKGGKLILRIDDTDADRCNDDFEQDILDSLRWLGLSWDEGPFRQSERLDIYRDAAMWLVQHGHAYPCFCTLEELKAKRDKAKRYGIQYSYDKKCYNLTFNDINNSQTNYSIRFKSNDNEISFKNYGGDIVKGISDGDYIIVRSNGLPTYNFTCSVDDKLMGITHVIRSNDHLANTFKQSEIIKKLDGFCENYNNDIAYVHCPMILTPESSKISKRNDDLNIYSISHLRKLGYLSQAILNYLATLGWYDNDLGEIFDVKQIKNFDLGKLTPSNSCFSTKKLNWYNRYHIKKMSKDDLQHQCLKYLKECFSTLSGKQLSELTKFAFDNFGFSNFRDLYQHINCSLSYIEPDKEQVDVELVKNVAHLENKAVLKIVVADVQGWINKLTQNNRFERKYVLENVRYLLTGNKVGIPVGKLIELLIMVNEWDLCGFVSLEHRLQYLKK